MDGPYGLCAKGLARCVYPRRVSEEARAPRLVERDPVGDDVTQGLLGCRGVVTKPHCGVPVQPAAGIFQGLRQVPVVERCVRGDAPLQASLSEPTVEVHANLVEIPGAAWEDPRPGDGEPVRVHAEPRHDGYVLGVPVVVVVGHVSGRTVRDVAGSVGERVPNARATAVFIDSALDLICRRGGSPDEIGWKALHIAPLKSLITHQFSAARRSG